MPQKLGPPGAYLEDFLYANQVRYDRMSFLAQSNGLIILLP